MSSPTELIQKKISYRIVHRIVQATASTFTLTLNPMSFPFDGLCRIEPRFVWSVSSAAKLVAINMDLSQPFAQSNNTTGDVRYNSSRLLTYHSMINGNSATSDASPAIVYAHLKAGQNITFTVTDATADAYTDYATWTSIGIDLVIRRVDLP